MWYPQKYKRQSNYLRFGARLQASQQLSPRGPGWVPFALEEAGDMWIVEVPTFCYFPKNF